MTSRSTDPPFGGTSVGPAQDGTTTRYDEPFGWWGYHWSPREARSLVWLVKVGALDTRLAAFLSLAVEYRRTLVVVAEPQEAGKTTLLTALLDFRRPEIEPVYLRGWYERFAFLDSIPPERAYLLCNEISAHLPTYLWGRGVRRVFEAGMHGYAFVTTMHAGSASGALDLLLGYPLEVPPEHIPAIDLVVSLGVGYVDDRLVRRVMAVEQIRPATNGFRIDSISQRNLLRAALEHRTGQMIGCLAGWAGLSDDDASRLLGRRERQLQTWLERGIVEVDAVRREIAGD